jgi:hypothetical protein
MVAVGAFEIKTADLELSVGATNAVVPIRQKGLSETFSGQLTRFEPVRREVALGGLGNNLVGRDDLCRV